MKSFIAIIFYVTFCLGATSESRQELLESIGFTKVQELKSLPESIITPLILTAFIPDSGDTIVNPEGERYGSLENESVQLGSDIYPITDRFWGFKDGEELIVIYTPYYIFVLSCVTPLHVRHKFWKGRPSILARYRIQMIQIGSQKTADMYVK